MNAERLVTGTAALAVLAVLCGGCGCGDAPARLRTAVDNKKPTLNECYRAALTRNRNAAGEMKITVHFNEAISQVNKVEVQSSAIKDPALDRCVEDSLLGVKVVPTPSANLKVDYTLRFTPSG